MEIGCVSWQPVRPHRAQQTLAGCVLSLLLPSPSPALMVGRMVCSVPLLEQMTAERTRNRQRVTRFDSALRHPSPRGMPSPPFLRQPIDIASLTRTVRVHVHSETGTHPATILTLGTVLQLALHLCKPSPPSLRRLLGIVC